MKTFEYQWVYVEQTRTMKATGKITKHLTIYLCKDGKVLKEGGDINSAYQYEREQEEKGVKFIDRIDDFLNNSTKIKKLTPKEFKKQFVQIKKNEQLTI